MRVICVGVHRYFNRSNKRARAVSKNSRTDHPSLGNNHTVADVNGDAVLDLIGTGTSSVSVMLGNSNGTFRPKVDFPTGGPPQDVAAGDFNSLSWVSVLSALRAWTVLLNEPGAARFALAPGYLIRAPSAPRSTSAFGAPIDRASLNRGNIPSRVLR